MRIFLLLVSIFLFSAHAAAEDKWLIDFELAKQLLIEARYGDAEKAFDDLYNRAKKHPSNDVYMAAAIGATAVSQQKQGKYTLALRNYEDQIRLLSKHPTYVAERTMALSNLGAFYIELGDISESIKILSIALKIAPDNNLDILADVRYNKAIAALKAKDKEQAEKDILAALEIWHDLHGVNSLKYARAMLVYSEYLAAANQFEKSKRCLEQALYTVRAYWPAHLPEFQNR